VVLIVYPAEVRTKIEGDVPKVMAFLMDCDLDVRLAALDAIEKLGEYRE
jgi:hypothetical protein